MDKKWSNIALILIGLGFLDAAMTLMDGFTIGNPVSALIGIGAAIVWWNVYFFQSWTLTALNILMGLKFLFYFVVMFQGWSLLGCLFAIGYAVGNIFYFNSPQNKKLLQVQDSQ